MQNRQKMNELLQLQRYHRDFIESYANQMNLDRNSSEKSRHTQTSAEFGSSTSPQQIIVMNKTVEDETI